MRALRYDRFGPPEVLHVVDLAEPVPRAGEVKVRVHAASLNPLDWKIRAGHLRWLPMFRRPPRTLGCDFAGEICGVSAGAKSHYVGERVFGSLHAVRARRRAGRVPRRGRGSARGNAGRPRLRAGGRIAGRRWNRAAGDRRRGAARCRPAHPDHRRGRRRRTLRRPDCQDTVGAHVVAVCSAANADFVRGLGADEVVDYARDDFTRRDDRFDVVFDAASASSFMAARHVLAVDGLLRQYRRRCSLRSRYRNGRAARAGRLPPAGDRTRACTAMPRAGSGSRPWRSRVRCARTSSARSRSRTSRTRSARWKRAMGAARSSCASPRDRISRSAARRHSRIALECGRPTSTINRRA